VARPRLQRPPDGRLVASQVTGTLVWETAVGRSRTNRRSRAPRSKSTASSSPGRLAHPAPPHGGNSHRSRPQGRERAPHWSGAPSSRQDSRLQHVTKTARAEWQTIYGGGSFWEPRSSTCPHLAIVVHREPRSRGNSRGPGKTLHRLDVALEIYKGQLSVLPQVHHDMWDSDCRINGVLFDGHVQKWARSGQAAGRRQVKTRSA